MSYKRYDLLLSPNVKSISDGSCDLRILEKWSKFNNSPKLIKTDSSVSKTKTMLEF